MKKFYITTAIDYVNAPPHLGHAYEKICADTIARWHRMRNEDVWFLTGTDENAQKNAQAAKEAGIDTKEFVGENSKRFIRLCKKLNISNNDFIRTTEKRHTEVSRLIFKRLYEKGDIYKGNYSGYYCDGCEAFITEKELEGGRCPEHHLKPRLIKEESYFFKLSKYQADILTLLKKGLVEPESRRNEIINRVEEGLNDLSVSRKNVEWGIPVPIDEGHRIYVWIDALVNYISALGYPDGLLFKKYWPADLHLIGKGINWFHSVIWPALLISIGIELPQKIFVHGYVNIKGRKMSKSLGNIVDPVQLTDKYGVDALRYFLLREIPFGEDGDFSEETFIRRFNSDLANDLGNLLYRTLNMVDKYSSSKVPERHPPEEETLREEAEGLPQELISSLDRMEIKRALENIWKFINTANKFIEDTAPWSLNRGGEIKRLGGILYSLLESLRIISVALFPFIPQTAESIYKQLGMEGRIEEVGFKGIEEWGLLKPGTITRRGKPLFPRIET